MKIGIFDSGLGGLFIMRGITKQLPEYDYLYFGDTKRVPYGNRSHETIFEFTTEALRFLFNKGCLLIVVACNTASAQSLREIQKNWIPQNFPNRKVLGVIIPTVEAALEKNPMRIGILATSSTVDSKTFIKEIYKRKRNIHIIQKAAPLLVPLVESGEIAKGRQIISSYVRALRSVDTVILGCTHYGILKNQIKRDLRKTVRVISQNDVIPKKLKAYLRRHADIECKLTKRKKRIFYSTDITPAMRQRATQWFGKKIRITLAP